MSSEANARDVWPPAPRPTVDEPRPGSPAAPDEGELAAADARLRNEAVSVPWAAMWLGIDVAHVELLVRSGALLAIPAPRGRRPTENGGLGYSLPDWQFDLNTGHPHPRLPAVLAAAAAAGWTGIDLHRFMTAPTGPEESSPADWLRGGEADRVVALIHSSHRNSTPVPARAGPPGSARPAARSVVRRVSRPEAAAATGRARGA